MKANLRLFLFLGATGLPLGMAGNILTNGDFSLGLSGWEVAGAVFPGVNVAAVTDEDAQRSVLYQGVSLEPGTYGVTVDFRNLLSPIEPSGFARDSFFASLYFTSTPELFDPLGPSGFDVSIPLFDVDSIGPLLFTGSLGISPAGTAYTRFSGDFALGNPLTVFAVFDLADLNGVNDNSLVLLDRVAIVPEPAAALLFGFVAALVGIFARRKR